MEDFVTGLTTSVTPSALWANLEPVAALIGILVVFAFGYHVLRRVVRGAGSGKPKI